MAKDDDETDEELEEARRKSRVENYAVEGKPSKATATTDVCEEIERGVG